MNTSAFEPENLKLLRESTLFWSRLGFGFDPPMRGEDGKMVNLSGDSKKFANLHGKMQEAGVRLQTSIIPSGWIGPNEYDFSQTDEILDALFQAVPDAFYLPRVKLNAPVEWSRENPEELFVYYGGPQTASEIEAMVGTLKHDLFGYEAPNGYYQMDDKRPNVGGLISNQSFTSLKWREDASIALRKFLCHIQQSPYANRIIGCHFGYGTMGESVLWGRISGRMGDYGICARKTFFDWGMKRYDALGKLREAWLQPELASADNLILPAPRLRSSGDFLRYKPEYRIVVDYDLFMSEGNAANIKHFGHVIKETAGKEFLTGCFYGYTMECYNSAYTGHLALTKILDCPHIDFLAAPASYRRREAGDPGGQIVPAQSVNLTKLWVEELDIRTHLSGYDGCCADNSETRTVFYREALKNIAQGSNYWWMDLGGGWEKSPRCWYDDKEIIKTVAEIRTLTAALQKSPFKRVSDLLLVMDDESIAWHAGNSSYHSAHMLNFVSEVNLSGASVDIYRLSDLPEIDTGHYKFVVFLNCFHATEQKTRIIRDALRGVKITLWLYLPGIISDGHYSPESTRNLTGIGMELAEGVYEKPAVRFAGDSPFAECEEQEIALDYSDFPVPKAVFQKQSDLDYWAVFSDGTPAIASMKQPNGKLAICSILPVFKAEHVRTLAKLAGCHLFVPAGCTVYGNTSFLAVFSSKPIQGKLHLKERGDYVSINNGYKLRATQEIELNIPAKGFEVVVPEAFFNQWISPPLGSPNCHQ